MSLAPGTRIGPYEILSQIGAGGMGEVYRARDARLARDVAIKVLPVSVSADPDRLRRFEQEARATGLLNHPNILAIYDAGNQNGAPYLVSELLEGETLRERFLSGPLSQRKAIEYAIQITQGLAVAHEKAIVHRDLKPENIFVTRDDRIKLLDFGLAKLLQPSDERDERSRLSTLQPGTQSGVVLGTVGYMSPEQVRGKQADQRSDIFAFGTILYEMLAGSRPFQGDSAVETMNAILKDEPPDLTRTNPNLSPTLERVVRRCLEKNPDLRFHSASDLGFALKELSGVTSRSEGVAVAPPMQTRRLPWLLTAGMAFVTIAALIFAYKQNQTQVAKQINKPATPTFTRLTFRRGNILHARFAPDGKTVVYGASWEGQPTEVFVTSPGSPESRPLGIQKADVLSVNSNGEMALMLHQSIMRGTSGKKILATASLTGGGATREIAEDVYDADWLPDNSSMAVLRFVNDRERLEFPIGNVIPGTESGMLGLRVSPAGDQVLFLSFPHNGAGSVVLANRNGKQTVLASGLKRLDLAAWSRDGKTVGFTAELNGRYGIYIVDLNGKVLFFMPLVSYMILHDFAPDGSLLLELEVSQVGIRLFNSGEGKERELSWLEGSEIRDMSADGKQLLFNESRTGGGPTGAIYIRNTDGSPAVKLANGEASALSPDGQWLLAKPPSNPERLMLIPTGPGASRFVTPENWKCLGGTWLDKESKVLGFQCAEPNHGPRVYKMDLSTDKIEMIVPDLITDFALAPDGKHYVVRIKDKVSIYPQDGANDKFLSSITKDDTEILIWNHEGLYTWNSNEYPPRIFRIDTSTGKRTLWKEIVPDDPSIIGIGSILLTPDTRTIAYNYTRILSSDLYLMSPPAH